MLMYYMHEYRIWYFSYGKCTRHLIFKFIIGYDKLHSKVFLWNIFLVVHGVLQKCHRTEVFDCPLMFLQIQHGVKQKHDQSFEVKDQTVYGTNKIKFMYICIIIKFKHYMWDKKYTRARILTRNLLSTLNCLYDF